MGSSANDALCELLRERGLVHEDRLRAALQEARRDKVPLEQVLLRRRELGPAEAQAALLERRERGRNCRTCARVTYLLSHHSESDTPCERCGGRLLPGVAQRLTRATLRRMRLDEGDEREAPTTADRLTSRHRPPPRQRVSIRQAPRPTRAMDRGAADVLSARIRDEIDRYLEQLQLVRRATREAREAATSAIAEQGLTEELGARLLKLEGLLNREGIPGLKGELLTALREEVAKKAGGLSGEEVEDLATTAVKRRLTEPDVRPLVQKMFDRAAQTFEERLAADGLGDLSGRVDDRATEAAELVLKRERVNGLAARLTALEQRLEKSLEGIADPNAEPAVDLGLLEERVNVLESQAAPRLETSGLEQRLAEVEQRTPDALDLEQRIAALEQRPAPAAGGNGDAVDAEGIANAVTETLRGDLEDLRSSARDETLRALESRLPKLEAQAREGVASTVLQDVMGSVEHEVQERVEIAQQELLDVVRRERAAALGAFQPPAPPPPPPPPRSPAGSQAVTREPRRAGHELLLDSLRGLLVAFRRRLRAVALVFTGSALLLLTILANLPDVHTAEAIVGPAGFRYYTGPARRLAALAASDATLASIADDLQLPEGRRLDQAIAGWPADRKRRLGADLTVTGQPGAVEHIVVRAQGESEAEATRAATLLAEAVLRAEVGLRDTKQPGSLRLLRPAELRERRSLGSAWPSALLTSLGLALLAGLLLELRRPVYHDAEEAARDLALPLLALVPHVGDA